MVRQTIEHKLKSFIAHPVTQRVLVRAKPKKNIWTFLGVAFFFFVPEIIAFFYSTQITQFAQEALLQPIGLEEQYLYELLKWTFQNGVHWSNLVAGVLLLIWMSF